MRTVKKTPAIKPLTAFYLGFLICYAMGGYLTYRAIDALDSKSLSPLRHAITWPGAILATADALREAKRD